MKRAKPTTGTRRLAVAWGERRFTVPIPKDEKQRLSDLHDYVVLDTPPEEMFDHITRLAARICQTPIALISLVDSERQWFKSKVGLRISETERGIAFCAHAILHRHLFEVNDAARDKRFAENPLVTSGPHIRFYAGAPLVTPNDHAIGTLCVIDRVPRRLTSAQTDALQTLGKLVIALLEVRRQLSERRKDLLTMRREMKELRNRLHRIASARST